MRAALPRDLSYAEENEIDLICMGVHGAGFAMRALFGSNTDRVLRQAPCLALIARSLKPAFTNNGWKNGLPRKQIIADGKEKYIDLQIGRRDQERCAVSTRLGFAPQTERHRRDRKVGRRHADRDG